MFQLYVFICLLACLQGRAVTIGPVSDLVIANGIVSPDGFTRSGVLAGGTHPGPTIVAQKGDTFKINVTNQLTNDSMLTSTSIHWHGLFQHHSNQMDGVSFVTQCPIAPGHSFLYDFNATDQVGTYWYHSHYGVQYCDGLRGPLIIYNPNDPYSSLYDIDDESSIITLMDWYNLPSPLVQRQVIADSVLINGVGRYDGGPDVPLAVINVQPGKRYRFRLLNMACKPNYIFSIDSHNLTIIEVDGQYVEPLVVDSIQIYAAQRYSFILETNQPVDNYWVHADPDAGTNATAIFRYAGAPDADPQNMTNSDWDTLNETSLHPLTPPSPRLLQEPDVKLDLVLGKNLSNFNFLINNIQYTSPSVPVLLQLLSGAMTAADLAPNGSVYTLPRNKVIELTFNPDNSPGGPHPFHLHGHSFAVIRGVGSTAYNYIDPVMRDTVNTGNTGDRVTIRFITDNPGPWFLHCHIDWHLSAGLAIVFAEAPEDVAASQPLNNASRQLCPIYNSIPQQNFPLPPVD
ncbi:laccase [Suillus fuscotomentosus]|uniref:Laccase n=1 Tax=Suillus fuscotomentosus TaxID=1912939 RepID=A0AAD4HLE9_9AGAM|nr:laccase [Suillus fuscotomentosus]KAG1899774.1 laccase [Suillus fuscotomentosus]